MSIQLQVRNKFHIPGKPSMHVNEWECDGETNRKEPTKFMVETAADYRRYRTDYEVRYVYDKKDFV